MFKPDKWLFFTRMLISDDLGELFIDTSPSKLEEVYEESNCRTPIIFLLSKGADPTNEFIAFKEKFKKLKKEEYEAEQALLALKKEEEMNAEENEEENKPEEHEAEQKHHWDDSESDNSVIHKDNEEKEKKVSRRESVINNQKNKDKDPNEPQAQEKKPGEFDTFLISLGQGQEQEAKDAIKKYGIKDGSWVFLQNCHLFSSFMPDLAVMVQSLQTEEIDPNFRWWLTSMPVSTFPVSILQNSLKLTTEPPSGVKANMKKVFDDIQEEKLEPLVKLIDPKDSDKAKNKTQEEIREEEKQKEKELEQQWKDNKQKKKNFTKIVFGLSLFHSVLQERKKFGPIGFNLRYDFNQSDFDTSSHLVNIYLSEADVEYIPWDSILYLIGEVTYGGSITDETDRTAMNSTLNKFLNENLFEKEKDKEGNDLKDYINIQFGKFGIPHLELLTDYKKYLKTLPSIDDPDIFGLNANANIVYELKESNGLLSLLTNVLPKDKASGGDTNTTILTIINDLTEQEIELIDKKSRNKIHDKVYDNELHHSLTIVLYQEIDKYNNLINKISTSLIDLKNAIEGTSIMSAESEEIFSSLLLNKIPLAWSKIGYSSFKPFGSWLTDLRKRVEFVNDWLQQGHPIVYWMSGLFYPQGFITGVFQNHARETKIPVSDILLKFKVMGTGEEIVKNPKSGVYVNGLYLEGASWDDKDFLVEQKPNEMQFAMPVIWFETTHEEEKKVIEDEEENDNEAEAEEEIVIHTYMCPMFKTGKRAQIIASSGSSLEKVIEVELPTKQTKDHWILRGAALIMQLDN